MDERARVVVIGGGVTGCSVAYHLARSGWSDVLLLEKGELTSGSTFHAAGLVTMFNPSPTMMRFRRYSIELFQELGVFDAVGSLRIASSSDGFKELQRGVSRARGIGLEVELLSAGETLELMPAASPDALFGAVWIPGDGYLDPHAATHALAGATSRLGATLRTGERVTGIELGPDRAVRAVRTASGRVETEVVVNACGIWGPQVAAMAGVEVPSTPVDHQHIALKAVPGSELPADMPCFRDLDNLVYGKAEAGGVLFGGYEPDPVARWLDGVPWDHGGRSLPPDMDRFEQLLRGAARRFPFLDGAEIVKLVCHPDAMTPDANPLVGPVPGVRGLWMAAGLSLNGFGGAGGIGRSLAEWITQGETELDMAAFRPWRFGSQHRDTVWSAELAKEQYRYYYRLRYPFDQDEWGRPKRTSALHGRMQELGAVFGTKNGWERPDHFRPGRAWRRAGADQRGFGFERPPWFDRLEQEHRAIRERVGMLDMSSFGKIEVIGPGALALLENAACNRIDRPVGSVVYSQFLNERGGIEADVTITRLAEDAFRVVTGAGTVDADLGRLAALRSSTEEPVRLREASDELSVIGMYGPMSRDVLASVSEGDVSDEALPFLSAATITVGGVGVLAQRVSYVGELGWELYVEPGWARQVWDRLWDAARPHEPEPVGYRTLDHLRIEKGYRYYGTDLTSSDTPYEAGLGFCVDPSKGFVGRGSLEAQRAAGLDRRIRTIVVGEQDYLPIYGGEAVLGGDQVVGRLRSAAYGFSVGRNVAYAYLPTSIEPGAGVDVEVFGDRVPAEVTADALYDPARTRVLG